MRISAPSLYDDTYFSGIGVSGSFQLKYGDALTGPISAVASSLDMRAALESLTGINTVKVDRSLSYEIVSGNVQVVAGLQYITCLLYTSDAADE